MEISHTEENYLKAIFKISERRNKAASTNAIAKEMSTSAASVTDMVKRLSDKDLIHYERYKGATLTDQGQRIATHLIRKHRLWEVFLVDKLSFSWDEVHEIAEQLEHIKSPKLVERLDAHLGLPKFDPHGDPIPDADGNFAQRSQVLLNEMKPGDKGAIVGVNDHTSGFLQYLDRMQLILGTQVEILECFEYDESVRVRIGADRELLLTKKVSQHLFVQKEVGKP
jgi:DtxR family Mn-dependent transcriptional regulator